MDNTKKNKAISDGVHNARLAKGSLFDSNSSILQEWDYEKNDVTPHDVTPQTHTKVWWKCLICGYSYEAEVGNRFRGSGCPCCAGRVVVTGINDLATVRPDLLNEWDYEKNEASPHEVHFSAKKKTWWKCRFKHSYSALISDKYHKNVGCPICSKHYKTSFAEQAIFFYVKKVYADAISRYRAPFLGKRELDVYIPSLKIAIEFDGQRYHKEIKKDVLNDELCEINGIELIRIREPNCPKYNRNAPTFVLLNLSTGELSKTIALVIDYIGELKIDIDINRDKTLIEKCFYNVAIENSIATTYPMLAKEWAKENGEIKPENVPATKSKQKYYWTCLSCRYTWKTSLAERIAGSGCPACSNKVLIRGQNDLASSHPQLVLEWHTEKNKSLTPNDISYGSQKNVWWICSKCGYEWSTRINRRVNGAGCPNCAKNRRKKPVYQYTLDNQLITVFSSVSDAAKKTGVSAAGISKACNSSANNKCCGFLWRY